MNAVQAKESVFVTTVSVYDAHVICTSVRPLLKVPGIDQPFMFPSGIQVSDEAHGEPVTIYVRDLTREVILELDKNDVLEADLESVKGATPISGWEDVSELLAETKLKLFYQASKRFFNVVSGACLSAACLYFKLRGGFPIPYIPEVGILFGVVFSVVTGVVPVTRSLLALRSNILMDAKGSYIDTDTGNTNMNGSMKMPPKKEEV